MDAETITLAELLANTMLPGACILMIAPYVRPDIEQDAKFVRIRNLWLLALLLILIDAVVVRVANSIPEPFRTILQLSAFVYGWFYAKWAINWWRAFYASVDQT